LRLYLLAAAPAFEKISNYPLRPRRRQGARPIDIYKHIGIVK
jgi:hypothetical protein